MLEQIIKKLLEENITVISTKNVDGTFLLELVDDNNSSFAISKGETQEDAFLTLIVKCVKTKAGML